MGFIEIKENVTDIDSLKAQCYDSNSLIPWRDGMNEGTVSGIRKVGVLTSGGDAPGMNAAIRAVVRAGVNLGIQIFGIKRGFAGITRGEIRELESHDVSETIQKGGTFLMTARSKTFMTMEGLYRAAKIARVYDLDCIVCIGGDGTFKGARSFARIGVPVICIPATIDNDISCTDYSIGFDTAMNTAIEAIDKLRDTASSHERVSVIEVMGRHAGNIALNVAKASGAECVMIPEISTSIDMVIRAVLEGSNSGKKHWVIVVAEGAASAVEIAKKIEDATGFESRATVLGYIQRGGSPSIMDRTVASDMGVHAIDCINSGRLNRIVVMKDGNITDIDIEQGLKEEKIMNMQDLQIISRLC